MGYEVSVEVSKCIEEISELILFIFSSYFPILCRYGIEGVSGYRSIGYVSGYGYGRSVKYPCNLDYRLFLTYPLGDGETLDSVEDKYNFRLQSEVGTRIVYIPLIGEDSGYCRYSAT